MRLFTPASLLATAVGFGVLAGAVFLLGVTSFDGDRTLVFTIIAAVIGGVAGFALLIATIGLGVELGMRAASRR